MALIAKQEVCIKCGEFVVSDVTGPYNDPDNLTGYGFPNADFGDTAPYTVSITLPKKTEPSFTLDMNLDPPAPDADGHYIYPGITTADIGLKADAPIPSGEYLVTVTFGTDEKKMNLVAFGDIAARIRKCICCFGWEKYSPLLLRLKGAKALHDCFKFAEAQVVIDELYRDTDNCCGCSDC